MDKETYKLEVICTNCGREQTIEIPKGEEFHDSVFRASKFGLGELVYCINCKCATLKREKEE